MKRWSKDDIKRQKLARATFVADGGKITLSAPPWEKYSVSADPNPFSQPRLAKDPARSGTVGLRQYKSRRKSIRSILDGSYCVRQRVFRGFRILHLHALVFQRPHRFLTRLMMSPSGNCYRRILRGIWRCCHRRI